MLPAALPGASSAQPLALHLRSLRQLHGSTSLGQAQLAVLAGIPVRQLRALESSRILPISLRPWLALAAALNCSIDALIARRTDIGAPVVVVLVRSHASVVLCIAPDRIFEVRRRGKARSNFAAQCATAAQLAQDYGAEAILTDCPYDSTTCTGYTVHQMRLATVAYALALADSRMSSIAQWALAAWPQLRRFVRVNRQTGKPSPLDRRGQLTLVAAAFASVWFGDVHPSPLVQMELPFQD